MKKILIVNDAFPPYAGGGANMIAFFHAKGLLDRGYEVTVFTTTQDKKVPIGWSDYQGLKIYTFYTNYNIGWWGYKSVYNPQVVKKFGKELSSLQPDVIHFHNIQNYFSYAVIAQAKRAVQDTKLFLTAHDAMSISYEQLFSQDGNYKLSFWQQLRAGKKRFNPFRNFLIRGYIKNLDKVIAVSGALRNALVQNGITNVEVIHNGIAVERFQKSEDTQLLRRALGLEDTHIVLFVGRFTPPKGSEVLLEAMKSVVHAIPRARLLVVGTDPNEGIYAALERFGTAPYTVFQSNVPYREIPAFYQLADLVVVPSIYLDPFPTVNLEAMAAGKAVIATYFGGSPEVVRNELTGYVVNPYNKEVLVGRIIELLQNKQKAQEMGEKGREYASKYFTLKQFLDTYETLY